MAMSVYLPELHQDIILEALSQFYPEVSIDNLIGDGNFGCCFEVNQNTVVKVTCDILEVYTAIQLLGENQHYPDVFKVQKMTDDFYAIEQSRMQPLRPDDSQMVEEIIELINERQEHDGGLTLDVILNLESEGAFDFKHARKILPSINNAVIELMGKTEIEVFDLSVDNVMLKSGNIVLIDQRESAIYLQVTPRHHLAILQHIDENEPNAPKVSNDGAPQNKVAYRR